MRYRPNQFKTILLVVLFSFTANISRSQDVNITGLLKNIQERIDNIHSAEYDMTETYSVLNIGEDTTVHKYLYKCYFQKNPADTLVGYKLASFQNDGHQRIYDGNSLFDNAPWNKTLTITPANKFPDKLKGIQGGQISSFFNYVNSNLQNPNDRHVIIGFENINGEKCYKLKITEQNNVQYYYISELSFLPVKSEVIFTHVDNKATRIQTFSNQVSNIKINVSIDQTLFTKSALLPYNKEVEFSEQTKNQAPKLLAIGTKAPNWELPSIKGGKVKLSSLAGKIVIMDFWFKACLPCQRQMLELEKLYNKTDKNKVVFIGVNTIDNPVKDKLQLFLTNRNITMQSVYNGKKIEPLYKAYSAPVLYVIGKDGKIIYTLDGYSDGLVEHIDRIIKQNL